MKTHQYFIMTACLLLCMLSTACSDDGPVAVNPNGNVGKANAVFSEEEWYPGGKLGTTTAEEGCYANESPAVNEQGLSYEFFSGEASFEKEFTLNNKPRRGLGPVWVRSSCLYCHPSYGHGKRMERYRAGDMGNGYLLVVYHPAGSTDNQGKYYASDTYISEVTGMPQTRAMYPFKAPIDEEQIEIEWKTATDEHGNKFADGETYGLIYPEVRIPQSAFNTDPKPDTYDVRIESTIGIYGSALLDAIDDKDIEEQYAAASQYAELNPVFWNAETQSMAPTAYYTLADGDKRIKKFTYALTRGSLQDGPGANAIWNITNVTRSDRHYLYTTKAWAKAMSQDEEVLEYIMENGRDENSLLHPYYGDGTREGVSELVNMLLGLNAKTDAEVFKNFFVDSAPAYGEEEMTDNDYYKFMVWHRGLAVPQARNLDRKDVQRGKTLFYEMGCTACHRPSWTTGPDNYWVCQIVKGQGRLPVYAYQKIWPYTDMIQHRLYMENDIRGQWCRTTPLWGRGLSMQETGASDRLHDCRARTVVEAIMWHGYSKKSDAYESTQKFYRLEKADRDAVVAFIESI